MRMLITAGALCAALLIAAVNSVHARTTSSTQSDTTTPIVVVGE